MKKRILLSLVSFFMMTAMWASLTDAYQIYVTAGANGKTYATAELTLNMKNKEAIGIWKTTLVLPAGVTFQSAEMVPGRYPEGYELATVVNEDGSVTFTCFSETEGAALTGTDGAVATVTVAIAGDAPLGDALVSVKDTKLTEPNGSIHDDLKGGREFTWTIEEGEAPGPQGDVNDDGKVDVADAQTVLNLMADEDYNAAADLNNDGKVDVADYQSVLNIMADQE